MKTYRICYTITTDRVTIYSAMRVTADDERQARMNAEAVLGEHEPPPAKIKISSVEVEE